ncbi:hypothetical protein WJX82_004553 [Trebouxia sp. C0006]
MLRLWGTTKAAKPALPLHGQLASDKPLTIEHLSTSQLRDLASITEEKPVAHGNRALLLDIVQEKLSSDLGKQWLVEHGKGDCPARVRGQLFSFAGELYVYRGAPTSRILNNCYDRSAWYSTEDDGHVLKGKFYLCGTNNPNLLPGLRQDDVSIYDLALQQWKCATTQVKPKGCQHPFIEGYNDQLIQFGGRDRRHLCVRAEEALWTFDTTALTWQQRHPSGPLPEPVDARGLAVVNDHAYLLASQLFAGGRLEVYELDLATWVWRLLPGQGSVLPCLRWFTPVVIQGQWLVCGGQTELADHTVQFNTSLYTFDFATLSWATAEVGGEALQPRMEYMATCHQGSLVIMGGVQPDYSYPEDKRLKAAETVQQIRLRAVEPALKEPDLTLRRYNTQRDIRSMRKLQCLTDTRVVVEGCGQEWHVHALMLASASTVFRHILEDVQPTGGKHELLLTDITPDSVANLAMDCHSSLLTQACAAFLESLETEEDGHALAQELHAVLFPPELPPDQCPSHPIKWVSHPIDCCSSYPLLDDWDEDDYDSSLEDEEASLTEVEHVTYQPAHIDADVKGLTLSANGGTGAHQGAEGARKSAGDRSAGDPSSPSLRPDALKAHAQAGTTSNSSSKQPPGSFIVSAQATFTRQQTLPSFSRQLCSNEKWSTGQT